LEKTETSLIQQYFMSKALKSMVERITLSQDCQTKQIILAAKTPLNSCLSFRMTLIKKMENFSTVPLPKKMIKQTVQEKTKSTESK